MQHAYVPGWGGVCPPSSPKKKKKKKKKKKERAHCHAQTFLLCASFTFSPASVFFSSSCCLIAKRCNTLPLHCHHWFKKKKKKLENSPILLIRQASLCSCICISVCLSVCLFVRPFVRLSLRLYTSCCLFFDFSFFFFFFFPFGNMAVKFCLWKL